MICIGCPMGCELTVTKNENGELVVEGATCARGKAYGIQETIAPERTVTALVAVEGKRRPLSVKTAQPIPKGKIFDALESLQSVRAKSPVKIGDVVLPNVCGTGVDVVATENL